MLVVIVMCSIIQQTTQISRLSKTNTIDQSTIWVHDVSASSSATATTTTTTTIIGTVVRLTNVTLCLVVALDPEDSATSPVLMSKQATQSHEHRATPGRKRERLVIHVLLFAPD